MQQLSAILFCNCTEFNGEYVVKSVFFNPIGSMYKKSYFSFFSLKGVSSTTCVGSDHVEGTERTDYEYCNTEPCPVWTDWRPLSGNQCSAPCGGGTIEERMDCVLADETPVTTCNGKLAQKIIRNSIQYFAMHV